MRNPNDPPPTEALPGGKYALIVLTLINLLNYIDRYVPSATKPLFQKDLNLTDTETSLPLTGFLIVYMITSPIFGSMSDRGYSRKGLIAFGVVFWSLATAAGAFATNFGTFMVARMGVGIGEAAYATIAPGLLSDYYPPARRSTVLSIFYCAIPIGAAMGFSIGGVVGDHAGWRVAFLVCGLPGLAVAMAVCLIREPPLGSMDTKPATGPPISWREVVVSLYRNRTYCYVVFGSTAATFGSGGMADWFPSYLERVHHFDGDTSSTMIGAVTVIGGFGGTALGSVIADRLKGRIKNPYLFVCWVGLAVACVMASLVMVVPSSIGLVAVLLVVCQLFLWFYNGPSNALIANCVDARIRTRAFSVSILVQHALGDAIAPSIVGGISDATDSLRTAVIVLPFAFAIGTIIWFIGWSVVTPSVNAVLSDDGTAIKTGDETSALPDPSTPSGATFLRQPLVDRTYGDSSDTYNDQTPRQHLIAPNGRDTSALPPPSHGEPVEVSAPNATPTGASGVPVSAGSSPLVHPTNASESPADAVRLELGTGAVPAAAAGAGGGALQPSNTDFFDTRAL